jgi:2-desacetyl-2-hydroxyethyl bacteriochlorophyllide A dehydrogenase
VSTTQGVLLERPRKLELARLAAPEAGADEALVRLRLAGICGSDLSAYRGTSPQVSYPRVIGHELLVDVVDGGPRPELTGRRAVVEPLVACGRCRVCLSGRRNCCPELRVLGVHVDGGMREETALPAALLHPVPEDMPDEVAVLAEPTTVAYRAVQRSAVEAGRTAVVFGAGSIGLLIAQLVMRARGCRALVVDIDPWRLDVAAQLGATPIDAGETDVAARVAELTGGEMAAAVFEATGNENCTRQTTDVVGYTGRIVLVGWNHGPVVFDTVVLTRKEAEVFASRNSTGAFPPVIQLLADGAIDTARMITHRFLLAEAGPALELLDGGGEHALKVLIGGA